MDLYREFLQKLKKLYGSYDDASHRFKDSSNSHIARELGYSDAQFSRLINNSATEGEYERANQNVDRILKVKKLEEELNKNGKPKKTWWQNPVWLFVLFLMSSIIGALIHALVFPQYSIEEAYKVEVPRDQMLTWSFETAFVKPYTRLDDLPSDCNYHCYKYQGKWELKEPYKIPFFRERSGFHYLATEVNMYARCMSENNDLGARLEGYEYQKHEIWYDQREYPLDSFTLEYNQLRPDYIQMNFAEHSNFVKLATVHTFFRNEFSINDSLIHRKGKVIGRDLEFTSKNELSAVLSDPRDLDNMERELNQIASNRLEDFSRPVSCENSPTPVNNFHFIKDGDEMQFLCQLTTGRVSFEYVKTYLLKDQFIKNSCIN